MIRECDRAIARHEEWLELREQAIANHKASGSTEPLPKSITNEPPPRPESYVDEGACDVSVDMMANGFDISESFTMEKSQSEEVVPVADPGIEARTVSNPSGIDRIELIILDNSSTWTTYPRGSTYTRRTSRIGDKSECFRFTSTW